MAGPSLQVGTIVELTTRALDEAVDAAMLFLPDGKLRQNALITVEDPLYPRDVPLQALRVKIDRRLGLWLLGQADSSAPAWLERVLPRRVLLAGATARRAQGRSAVASCKRRAPRAAARSSRCRVRPASARSSSPKGCAPSSGGAVRRRLPRDADRAARRRSRASAGAAGRGAARGAPRRRGAVPRSLRFDPGQARSGCRARRPRSKSRARCRPSAILKMPPELLQFCAELPLCFLRHRRALRGSRRSRPGGAHPRAVSVAGAARGDLAADLRAPAGRRRRRGGRLGRDRAQARARRRAHPIGGALGRVGSDGTRARRVSGSDAHGPDGGVAPPAAARSEVAGGARRQDLSLGRSGHQRRRLPRAHRDDQLRQERRARLRHLGLRRQALGRRRHLGAVLGPARHRQDHVRRRHRARARHGTVPRRSVARRLEVDRRDREEPGPRLRRGAALERGRACSTRPTRSSPSAPRSSRRSIATPTSRSTSSCSAWRRSTASRC